ncbi:MAG: dockerin type I repeat-containing protein [Ruminococcus sp.]|nr:dockerin type I repeat-containing protein [Ruminococcus sp.]
MKLKKLISAALAAAVMLTIPLSLPDSSELFMMSASAEGTKDVTDYTYTVTPLLAPFNELFYVKTDNPDPKSFRFIDKSTKYKNKYTGDNVTTEIEFYEDDLFADVKYENTETMRVKGGYIFWSSFHNVDGGKLVLQKKTVYKDGWYTQTRWDDTDITVKTSAVMDDVDYLIKNYAKGDTFFEKLSAVQTGLDSECLYSGSYIRGQVYRAADYWQAYISPYVDQGLYIGSPYRRKDNKRLLASYLFPFFLDSISFPAMMGAVAERLDSKAEFKWSSYAHYLIDVTYNGETRSYGGAGEGDGQGITEDKIAYKYTFKNSEATTLDKLRALQKTYREIKMDDDIPRDDELTWKQIYDTIAPGAWVKGSVGSGYYYWYNKGTGENLGGEEFGVGSNIYWGGDLKWARNCWVDGRYIDGTKDWAVGETFEDHSTDKILVHAVPFFELKYGYDYDYNYDTGKYDKVYADVEVTEKVMDLVYEYDEENDRWEADSACYMKGNSWYSTNYDTLKELSDLGYINKKYLKSAILTHKQVNAMDPDRSTDLFPRSGFIYDGTAAPGTPFYYANGDVNGDGAVDTTDLAWFARYLAGWTDYSFLCESADIDGDGNVTTTDYSLLARALAGWKGYAEQYEIPV